MVVALLIVIILILLLGPDGFALLLWGLIKMAFWVSIIGVGFLGVLLLLVQP